jgi:hypothetical protein
MDFLGSAGLSFFVETDLTAHQLPPLFAVDHNDKDNVVIPLIVPLYHLFPFEI